MRLSRTVRRRHIAGACSAALMLGPTPASATGATQAVGKESFRGVLLASGESGNRTVFKTFIAADGVFTGAGRIVEVPNRPRDPDRVSRDDLVFREGRMHLINTNKTFKVSLNPRTCAVRITIRQTSVIRGGTGKFRNAVGQFAGGVQGRGVASRNENGTCSERAPLLLEVDAVSGSGFLSF